MSSTHSSPLSFPGGMLSSAVLALALAGAGAVLLLLLAAGEYLFLLYATVLLLFLGLFFCALVNPQRALALSLVYFPLQISFGFSSDLNIQSGLVLIGLLLLAFILRIFLGKQDLPKLDTPSRILLTLFVLNLLALLRQAGLQDAKRPAYLFLFFALYIIAGNLAWTPAALDMLWRHIRISLAIVLVAGAILYCSQFLFDETTYQASLTEYLVPLFLGHRVAGVFAYTWNVHVGSYLRATSTFFAPQDLSYFLGLVLPLLILHLLGLSFRKARFWDQVLFAGGLLGLVATFSRGGWVAGFVAITYLLASIRSRISPRQHLRIQVLALGGLLCLGFVSFFSSRGAVGDRVMSIVSLDDRSNQHRFVTWLRALDNIRQNPVFGGTDMQASQEERRLVGMETIRVMSIRGAHNTYLEFGQALGVPGLLLGVYLYVSLFHQSRRMLASKMKLVPHVAAFSAVVLWFSIHNIFDSVFYSPKPASCFWLLAGVAASVAAQVSRSENADVGEMLKTAPR